jgi:excisionase family DNA binding protein
MTMSDDRLLTVEDVAARLRVHPETVRRMLRQQKLHGTQPMTKRAGWRIAESELARFLGGEPKLPPSTVPPERRSEMLVANLLHQAERARERDDAEGAARFEMMAAEAARGSVE